MLAVASSGLIVPFERLKKRTNGPEHPTKDRERFGIAAERLDALEDEKPFWGSTLWPRKVGTWKRGTLALTTLEKYPDDPMGWEELKRAERIKDDLRLESVLATIRNALAHGNIFVAPGGRKIGEIIFLSEKRRNKNGISNCVGYNFLICSPNDFRDLWAFGFSSLKACHFHKM